MTDWWLTLPDLHARVWHTLVRGAADRHAPARHLAFATVAPDGAPEIRTVVLRATDVKSCTVEIHTDLRSAKVAALRANHLAAALAWDPRAHLQIRLSGPVEILSGQAVQDAWAKVPAGSRVSYGMTPAPGMPVDGPSRPVQGEGEGVFAVLRMQVAQIDALHLGTPHRRARFRRDDCWTGEWLSP